MSHRTQLALTWLLLLTNLWSNGTASAKDARLEVIKCQQYSQPEERLECFDRARLLLIEEMNVQKAADASFGIARDSGGSAPKAITRTKVPPSITGAVSSVQYIDGKPRFVLANGQVWQSADKRRLSFQAGKDSVKIDKTPVGFLLHFNNSFFALLVSRVN